MNKKQYDSKREQLAKLQNEVNTYEERQAKIKAFKNQMSELVRNCIQKHFDYDGKTVTFACMDQMGQLRFGKAKATPGDKFEKDLGQIIAVFRAFELPINKVVKLVEKEPFTGGYITSSQIYSIGSHVHSIPYNFASSSTGTYSFELKA